jgi:predicted Zn-dependent protease
MLRFSRRARPSVITLADRARDAGQWDLAAQYCRKGHDRNPSHPAIWVHYGHALKEIGHLADAEAAYRRATAGAPEIADPYLQFGPVLKLQGRTGEAKAAYLRALRTRDGEYTEALQGLAGLGWSETGPSEGSDPDWQAGESRGIPHPRHRR